MSSLIEQAAERLAKIREAGIDLPELSASLPLPVPPAVAAAAAVPVGPQPAPLSKLIELDLVALAAAGYLVPAAPRSHIWERPG